MFTSFEEVVDHFRQYPSLDYARLRAAAMHLAKVQGEVSADDIRRHFPPPDGDPRVIGAALGSLVHDGVLEPVGWFGSERRSCHHRPIRRFRYLDAAHASE